MISAHIESELRVAVRPTRFFHTKNGRRVTGAFACLQFFVIYVPVTYKMRKECIAPPVDGTPGGYFLLSDIKRKEKFPRRRASEQTNILYQQQQQVGSRQPTRPNQYLYATLYRCRATCIGKTKSIAQDNLLVQQ